MTKDRNGTERVDRRRTRASAVVLCAGSLTLLLAGCGTSSASSTTSTTTHPAAAVPDNTACALISASDVRASVGTQVKTPTWVVRGTETTCTYRASTPAKSIIIHYNTAWSNQDFSSDQSSLASKGQHITNITGLGDMAFSATTTTGGYTVNTVVAVKGALGVLITGTAPLAKEENLTDLIITKVVAGGSTTTTSVP